MPSEARRGLVRIASNYARLFTTVFLGLFIVRLHLQGVGDEGYSLIALLAGAIGFAEISLQIVHASLIRELAAAWHDREEGLFERAYSSAFLITVGVAGVNLLVFAVIWLLIPLFNIPPEWIGAARVLVLAKGIESTGVVLLAPPFNMYRVMERMAAANLWLLLSRLATFLAAVVVYLILGLDQPTLALKWFGISSAGLTVLVYLVAAVRMAFIDRRTIPHPSRIDRASIGSILGIGRWNLLTLLAIRLHLPLDAVIMNVAFGLPGNLIWGFATNLAAYVRMIAVGMTDGIDAVAARLSSTDEGRERGLKRLMHQSTRLHGLVTFPAMAVLLVLAEPILMLWVGDRINENVAETVARTSVLIRILAIGLAARAIADNWMRILYGAGHVREYARNVFLGGLCNPLAAGTLLLLIPEPWRYTAVAWAFSGVITLFHLVLLPTIAARVLQIPVRDLFSGLTRPLVVTLACVPILLLGHWLTDDWGFVPLATWGGIFGVTYLLLSGAFVLTPQERKRFVYARFGRKGPSTHGAASASHDP